MEVVRNPGDLYAVAVLDRRKMRVLAFTLDLKSAQKADDLEDDQRMWKEVNTQELSDGDSLFIKKEDVVISIPRWVVYSIGHSESRLVHEVCAFAANSKNCSHWYSYQLRTSGK